MMISSLIWEGSQNYKLGKNFRSANAKNLQEYLRKAYLGVEN